MEPFFLEGSSMGQMSPGIWRLEIDLAVLQTQLHHAQARHNWTQIWAISLEESEFLIFGG